MKLVSLRGSGEVGPIAGMVCGDRSRRGGGFRRCAAQMFQQLGARKPELGWTEMDEVRDSRRGCASVRRAGISRVRVRSCGLAEATRLLGAGVADRTGERTSGAETSESLSRSADVRQHAKGYERRKCTQWAAGRGAVESVGSGRVDVATAALLGEASVVSAT